MTREHALHGLTLVTLTIFSLQRLLPSGIIRSPMSGK
jgi:hypothetical protein